MGEEYNNAGTEVRTVYLDDFLSPEQILQRWYETPTDITLEEFAIAELRTYMPLSQFSWGSPNYRWRSPIRKLELEIALHLLATTTDAKREAA